jgi:hypothetical protein
VARMRHLRKRGPVSDKKPQVERREARFPDRKGERIPDEGMPERLRRPLKDPRKVLRFSALRSPRFSGSDGTAHGSGANASRERMRLSEILKSGCDATRGPHAPSPSPGGGGSARRTTFAEPGWGDLADEDSPHPDAHFVRVDPPPPGEGKETAFAARTYRTAIGATVEPVAPWIFSGCMMKANS